MNAPIFIGRSAQLAQCRRAVDAGLDVHLVGEKGVGKTALARRINPQAIYVAHCNPVSELLGAILGECYARGWWTPPDGEDASDEAAISKLVRKMTNKSAASEAVAALKARKEAGALAVLVLDDFDTAPATVVRLVRQIAAVSTVVAVSTSAKPAQAAFLFGCSRITLPRLSKSEAEELVARLLEPHTASGQLLQRDRAALHRQIVEQAQGVPAVAMELVKRAAARGQLNTRAVAGEDMSGARTVDMTPALIVFLILLVGARVAMRGIDADITVLLGFAGAFLMLARLFMGALMQPRSRR